jgi:copper resistance protein C
MPLHRSSRPVMLLALLVLPLIRPSPVTAHAFLDHAEPSVGSTVTVSPTAVTLAFTEPIEPAFSRVEVRDANGQRIDTASASHPAPDRLSLALPPLSPGTYTVHWNVISIDTHETEGTFRFSLSAP